MFRLIVALVAMFAVVKGDCDSQTSQKDCQSASCQWCTSGAVGDSCVSNEDAAALPSSVFTCTATGDNYHFLASSNCESLNDESKCMSTSECSWCDSAAVGSSCMSSSDAASLPAAVFTCKDASVSYHFLATSDCESFSDENKCMSTSECSWCDSAAVGSSCMSSDDAAGLPAAVFTCKDASASEKLVASAKPSADNYYFMSTTDCESIGDKSKCTSTSGCSFCSSAAVGDSCMSSNDAAGLPAAVFTCENAAVSSSVMLGSTELGGSWQWEVTLDMFEGVVEGFFSADAPDLKSCADEAVDVYNQFDAAIKMLQSGESTSDKIEQGLSDMGNVLLSIQSLVKDCKSADSEITSLVHTISSGFVSPWSFAYHVGKDLLVNGFDIYGEITTAVSDWEAQSYKSCGNQIGMALEKLLVGSGSSLSVTYSPAKVENGCQCPTGETCCNTCDKKLGGCTCSTKGSCPAGVGALRGAEGFEYVMQNGEVTLTGPTDYLRKTKINELDASVGLGVESACAVAGYLRSAGFPESSIGTMVCISKWESSYNCGATNHNTDGSTDYGLFEINSYYWCSGDAKSKYDECNASCSSLMNCQLNANCAYKVYKEQGYNAWYGYKSHKSECDSAQAPC